MTTARGPELDAFAGTLGFALDRFQLEACEALEAGRGVLVAAPTGAGKTIVGEFAVHLALAAGGRCFYTTPIKALSNQKFHDLTKIYGEDRVGLLTGDSSINGHAPIIVMTTEVLRNMLYADSSGLRGLTHVVLDEVHYLADRFRGAVWEEVILQLDRAVKIVALSATVSNAEQFGAWIETVRGDSAVVVDDVRPVPLSQHMVVGTRVYDLYEGAGGPNQHIDRQLLRAVDRAEHQHGHQRRVPPRAQLLERLDGQGLLPAIEFIFSRAGCDAAVSQCLTSSLVLSDASDVGTIREIVARHTAELAADDLEVLGYRRFLAAAERGFAAHHAGMLPAFRRAVEELFERGLLGVVFATETLALGINMPARSVLIERLVKYNGEAHVPLTPGEYTQLTGRAGRRGIDHHGHALVFWGPGVDPGEVAGLAGARTFELRSSFRPGYNMTINLLGRLDAPAARALLERSFAQFQADASVVSLNRRADELESQIAAQSAELARFDGDHVGLEEYFQLRAQLSERERLVKSEGRRDERRAIVEGLFELRPGTVFALSGGKRPTLAVVVEPARDRVDPRPLVVTADRWSGRVGAHDLKAAPETLGRLKLPRNADPRHPKGKRVIAAALGGSGIRAQHGPGRRGAAKAHHDEDTQIRRLRKALRAHPLHGNPELRSLEAVARRRSRLQHEVAGMRESASARTDSLVRTFDAIAELLREFGYLDAENRPTDAGRLLSRIYSESDLLVAQCLRQDAWRGLSAPELASVVSTVVYESRRDNPRAPLLRTEAAREALSDTLDVWKQLRRAEDRRDLPLTRELDPGIAAAIHRWAEGADLTEVLAAAGTSQEPFPAGDFVRWCRQVIDLLEQIRLTSGDDPIAETARAAVRGIRRGVVTADA